MIRQHRGVLAVLAIALLMSAAPAVATHSPIRASSPPAMQLPFAAGQTWVANGPHDNAGTGGGTFNSIDFGPQSTSTSSRVVAVAPGRVVVENGCLMTVRHAGGWTTKYSHVANQQFQLNGDTVEAGTYLGDAGRVECPGDVATADHVHLSLWLNGDPAAVSGMRFGDYTVHAGTSAYLGKWRYPDGSFRDVASSGFMSVPLTSTVPARGSGDEGGSLAVTPDGWMWLAAVKENGDLYTRRGKIGEGWTSFSKQGAGNWAAAEVAATPDGWIWLAALKENGDLYTRRGKIGEGWTSFSKQGTGNWAAADLAATPDGWIWLAALKQDGDLYTRRGKIDEGWTSFGDHGSGDWASAELAATPDGWIWLAAVKEDGDLYTHRGKIDEGWTSLTEHGSGNWASAELAATPDGWIWLAAVKEDGDLYTHRGKIDEGWTSFSSHGAGSWASADLAATPDGWIWLAAVKESGDLYTRRGKIDEGWTSFYRQGAGGWASWR